jgi:hypothetical protein
MELVEEIVAKIQELEDERKQYEKQARDTMYKQSLLLEIMSRAGLDRHGVPKEDRRGHGS